MNMFVIASFVAAITVDVAGDTDVVFMTLVVYSVTWYVLSRSKCILCRE